MANILVLGITGMLGSMVYDYLSKNERFNVYGTCGNVSAGLKMNRYLN